MLLTPMPDLINKTRHLFKRVNQCVYFRAIIYLFAAIFLVFVRRVLPHSLLSTTFSVSTGFKVFTSCLWIPLDALVELLPRPWERHGKKGQTHPFSFPRLDFFFFVCVVVCFLCVCVCAVSQLPLPPSDLGVSNGVGVKTRPSGATTGNRASRSFLIGLRVQGPLSHSFIIISDSIMSPVWRSSLRAQMGFKSPGW